MASVCFQVPLKDPTTLYYHLKIHPRGSIAHPEETSICQNAVFVHRCLSAKRKGDADWVRNAVDSSALFLLNPKAQLNMMLSSPLISTPDIVSPGREDYKAPNRKRVSTQRHIDNTVAARTRLTTMAVTVLHRAKIEELPVSAQR